MILKKYKKGYHQKIHRLIADAFIDNPQNKPQVDHIDKVKNNNSINNLRWVSNREYSQNRLNQSIYGHNISKTLVGHFEVQICIFKGNVIKKTFQLLEEAIVFRNDCLEKIDSGIEIVRDKTMDNINLSRNGTYTVDICRHKRRINKTFKTLPEAIKFRDTILTQILT